MENTKSLILETLQNLYLGSSDRKAIKRQLKSEKMTYRELKNLQEQILSHFKDKGVFNNQSLDWYNKISEIIMAEVYQQGKGKAYFTPNDDLRTEIIDLIEKARHTLDICLFTISDDHIAKAIINAHFSGVKVRIVTDRNKIYDKGNDMHEFADNGIAVKLDPKESWMHHKFAIIDEEITVSGSFNWTRSGADKNYEDIVIFTDKSVVERYLNRFNQMWNQFKERL